MQQAIKITSAKTKSHRRRSLHVYTQQVQAAHSFLHERRRILEGTESRPLAPQTSSMCSLKPKQLKVSNKFIASSITSSNFSCIFGLRILHFLQWSTSDLPCRCPHGNKLLSCCRVDTYCGIKMCFGQASFDSNCKSLDNLW